MKSWQTKLGGSLAALGYWASLQPDPWWLHKVGEAVTTFALAFLGGVTRQNNVPSEAVPGAIKAAEKIKGDTKPPFKS